MDLHTLWEYVYDLVSDVVTMNLSPRLLQILLLTFLTLPSYSAEGGHKLPLFAEKLPGLFFTNSMIMTWIAAGIIIIFCQIASKKITLVPQGIANFAEWVTESLYDFLGGILGDHLVKKTFWFFASLFLFILVTNWLALFPGVGTVGWNMDSSHPIPLFRGGNADVNMTSAMALLSSLTWLYWAITENGVKGFFAHIFAPKSKSGGFMAVIMIVVFFIVGILEVISIGIRPLALTFRLFGNIYAGEQALEALMAMGPKWLAFLPPLAFYFIEILVGFIQALVFTLLTAVFLNLICDHGDEHH